jgi:putative phosphoribosyl transferase
MSRDVEIGARGAILRGVLDLPAAPAGLVLFAHANGVGRHGARNPQVAAAVRKAGLGTLVFDLLTPDEEAEDRYTGHLRFNIDLLAQRLESATEWALTDWWTRALPLGYCGASAAAAAALIAAARLDDLVGAVVSLRGRPDLAGSYLARVTAPTLLIVGERDEHVLALNQEADARLRCTRALAIVPQALPHFEDSGALERVATLATDWFSRHLAGDPASRNLHETDARDFPAPPGQPQGL